MEQLVKEKVSQDLNEWINSSESNSLNSLSEIIGENRAYISKIKNQQYHIEQSGKKPTVIADRVFYKIASAIGQPITNTVHFETENFQNVRSAVGYARHTKRRLLLWSEDSGVTKTYGLEWVSKNEPNTIYIKVFSNMKGKELIDEIMKALRIKTDVKSNLKRLQMIADNVITNHYVIMIDEMEKAKPDLYRVIKDLTDYTYNKVGLIICGIDLFTEIKTAASRKKSLMPQIYRRFRGSVRKLKSFSKADVLLACKQFNIEDRQVQLFLNEHIYDMAKLSEWFEDISTHLIEKGDPVTIENLKELFKDDITY